MLTWLCNFFEIRRVAITQASFLCLTAGSPAAMLAGVERLDLLEKWQVSS